MASIDLNRIVIKREGGMKIHGKKIQGPNEMIVPIPRSNGDDIVFKVQGVIDMAPFEKLCPPPQAPKIMLKGGVLKEDIEDKGFRDQVTRWSKKRSAWIAITALRATPGLEWEKVKYDDPETWHLFEEELKESGLSDNELTRIIMAVMEVNGLNEERIEEARQRFLLMEAERQKQQNSQMEEPKNTQPGEHANGSILDHQDLKTLPIGTN